MKPAFQVIANNQDITARIAERLISLRVTDERGIVSDEATITLDDRGGDLEFPPTGLDQGVQIKIALGYQGNTAHQGLFYLDEVEASGPPAIITFKCKANEMRKGLRSPKTRSWDATTIDAIVSKIANENDLAPAVASILGGIAVEHIDQTAESDMNFLHRISVNYDAVAKTGDGRLLFAPKGEAQTLSRKSMPVFPLALKDISSWRFSLGMRGKYKSVVTTWRDVATAQDCDIVVGSGEPSFRVRHLYANADLAKAAAEGKLDSLSRGQAKLSLSLPGNPLIAAESLLALSGVRAGVDGTWLVVKVEHMIDKSGYRTSIEAEVPNAAIV